MITKPCPRCGKNVKWGIGKVGGPTRHTSNGRDCARNTVNPEPVVAITPQPMLFVRMETRGLAVMGELRFTTSKPEYVTELQQKLEAIGFRVDVIPE